MSEQFVAAIQWASYDGKSKDLLAAFVVDLTTFTSWRFKPSGVVPGVAQAPVSATGVVVDNMQGASDVTVTAGPIVELVPRYQKTVIPLSPNLDVVIAGNGVSPRAYFYTGTFHGNSSNVAAYAVQVNASMNTVTSGTIDAYFNTLRWQCNVPLAANTNLDSLTDSGFYDVLNPTNFGAQLPAGTWAIMHLTYSQSDLWAAQVARSVTSGTVYTYERRNLSGTWTPWQLAPYVAGNAVYIPGADNLAAIAIQAGPIELKRSSFTLGPTPEVAWTFGTSFSAYSIYSQNIERFTFTQNAFALNKAASLVWKNADNTKSWQTYNDGGVLSFLLDSNEKIRLGIGASSIAVLYGKSNRYYNENNGHYWDFLAFQNDFTLKRDEAFMGSFNGSSGAYSPASDKRLKKDIETIPMDRAVSSIMAMRPVTYLMMTQAAGDRRSMGFIAQELVTSAPEAVMRGSATDTLALGERPWAVERDALVALLVCHNQSLETRITALSVTVAQLKKALGLP